MAEVDLGSSGWHPGISHKEEQKVFKDLDMKVLAFEEKQEMKPVKDTIAWRPEYNDMITTYLTPKEIKQYEGEGKTKKEIFDIAENEIVNKSWQRMRGFVRRGKDSPYNDIAFYKNTYYAEHRLREALGCLRDKDFYRHRELSEWGYPDKVAGAEKNISAQNVTETKSSVEPKKAVFNAAVMAKMKQGGR